MRVTSPYREESMDEAFPMLQIGETSQPHQWPQPGQKQSTDSTDDKKKMVNFVDIMNAAEDAGSEFEGGRSSLKRWPGLWFSDESSNTEYSSATEVSNGTSSPQFEEDCESCGSIRVYTREIIVLTKTLDEDEDVDIIH